MARKKKEVVEEEVKEETTKKGKGKKASEKKPAAKGKGKGKGKKADAPKRGRKAGVGYEVKEEYKETILVGEEDLMEDLESFSEVVNTFVDKGNKASAAKARAYLQSMAKKCKDLRKTIQNAKIDMNQVDLTK